MYLHVFFPTFVSESHYKTPDQNEHNLIFNSEYTSYNGVIRSNSDILESTPLLRQWIQSKVDQFCVDVLAMNETLKITQSWAVKSKEKHSLYQHIHPNSVISGVYYVDVADSEVGTTFYRPDTIFSSDRHSSPIVAYTQDPVERNTRSWLVPQHTLPAVNHHLYLFPSHLAHGVTETETPNHRCVLSFNTWFDGEFGDENLLTQAW